MACSLTRFKKQLAFPSIMDIRSLALAVGIVAGCASSTGTTKIRGYEVAEINKVGSYEIRPDQGHNIYAEVYQVRTKTGDTLEKIAHDFWLKGIGDQGARGGIVITPDDLLHQYSQRQRWGEYEIKNPTQKLPAGITFEYRTYEALPGIHMRL